MKRIYKQTLELFLITFLFTTNIFAQVTETEPNNNCGQAVASGNYLDQGVADPYIGTVDGNSGDTDWWVIPITNTSGNMTINLSDSYGGGFIVGRYYIVEDRYPTVGNSDPCATPRTSASISSDSPTSFTWTTGDGQDGGNLIYILIELKDENNVGPLGYTMTFSSSEPLPVELTSFTATSLENKVVLNWETATEVNNYGFEIERTTVESLLATTPVWETLGFVEGCGNSNSPKSYEFIDQTPLQDAAEYRLKQIDTDGNSSYYSQTAQVGGFGTTDIKDNQLPKEYALEQNYPNPFNPSTTISYAIPNSGMVKLSVYDILGKEVAVLVNQEKQAGNYNVEFNASNLTSGVYFYKIQAGNFSSFKKMLLVK